MGGRLTMATRPARDSEIERSTIRFWEPLSTYSPGDGCASTRRFNAASNSGAYCTSSRNSGGGWFCRKRSGSCRARRLDSAEQGHRRPARDQCRRAGILHRGWAVPVHVNGRHEPGALRLLGGDQGAARRAVSRQSVKGECVKRGRPESTPGVCRTLHSAAPNCVRRRPPLAAQPQLRNLG